MTLHLRWQHGATRCQARAKCCLCLRHNAGWSVWNEKGCSIWNVWNVSQNAPTSGSSLESFRYSVGPCSKPEHEAVLHDMHAFIQQSFCFSFSTSRQFLPALFVDPSPSVPLACWRPFLSGRPCWEARDHSWEEAGGISCMFERSVTVQCNYYLYSKRQA